MAISLLGIRNLTVCRKIVAILHLPVKDLGRTHIKMCRQVNMIVATWLLGEN